jgi:hypothetical protein
VKIFILLALYGGMGLEVYAKTKLCQDMKVSEVIVVKNNISQSKSGVEMKYTLHKVAKKSYDVYLNLLFKRGKEYNGPRPKNSKGKATKKKLDEYWKKKTRRCFSKYPHTLSDGYGRSLNLKVWDKQLHRDIPRPPKVKIKMVKSSTRSHSRAYRADVSCTTIIHEVLHLMGLADEYEAERGIYKKKVFWGLGTKNFKTGNPFDVVNNCRSPEPRNSFLGDHYNIDYHFPTLKSGHIDTVIYPNCKAKNELYYKCAKNAYRTSKQKGGRGCLEAPRKCQEYDWAGI